MKLSVDLIQAIENSTQNTKLTHAPAAAEALSRQLISLCSNAVNVFLGCTIIIVIILILILILVIVIVIVIVIIINTIIIIIIIISIIIVGRKTGRATNGCKISHFTSNIRARFRTSSLEDVWW